MIFDIPVGLPFHLTTLPDTRWRSKWVCSSIAFSMALMAPSSV